MHFSSMVAKCCNSSNVLLHQAVFRHEHMYMIVQYSNRCIQLLLLVFSFLSHAEILKGS